MKLESKAGGLRTLKTDGEKEGGEVQSDSLSSLDLSLLTVYPPEFSSNCQRKHQEAQRTSHYYH